MQNRLKINQLLPLGLIILPAWLLLNLINKYGVNVPYLDQWGLSIMFVKFYDGTLSLLDLLKQNNESRKFFTRLIYIGLAHLTHWNIRYEMLVVFLLACLILYNCYRFLKVTVTPNPKGLILIVFFLSLLIFNPIQHETWLIGMQVDFMMPCVCITTCMLVAYSKLNIKAKFGICMALSTISTFSYANGLLCWVVVPPVLIFTTWKHFTNQKWLALVWLAGFASNLVLYFYDYHKPEQTPSFSYALFHPIEAVAFFFAFLGAPLGTGLVQLSPSFGTFLVANVIIGCILFALFLAAWFYCIIHWKDGVVVYRMLGWLMIGCFPVLSAVITTLGRVGFGVVQSFAPRYIVFAQFLAIALIPLIAIVVEDALKRGYLPKNERLLFRGTLALSIVFLIFYLLNFNESVKRMQNWKADLLQGKACLLFINIVEEKQCVIQKLYGNDNLTFIKNTANDLDKLNFLNPGLINSSRIQYIEGIGKPGKDGYGYFDRLDKEGNQLYTARGWSILPERDEPADAVVLTYEKTKGEDIVFAVSDTRVERKDVVKSTRNSSYLRSGWQKSFEANRLPKGTVKIKAWAFDTDTGKAFNLTGSQTIKNQ